VWRAVDTPRSGEFRYRPASRTDTTSDGDEPPDDTRDRVRFYLLDHRTPLGKAIDIVLFGLNLVFIGVFVVESLLRLYGARTDVRRSRTPTRSSRTSPPRAVTQCYQDVDWNPVRSV